MEYLVLGARRYDFTAPDGHQLDGVSVQYVDPEDVAEEETEQRGWSVLKIAGAKKLWDALARVPGYYKLDFKQRPGKGGKPTLQLVDAQFVKAFDE